MGIKIISGFQTGADIGGIKAAKALGIETGGYMTKGFMTEDGPKPEYAELYGAEEIDSRNYSDRTEANVKACDVYILFCEDFNSPGTKCFYRHANNYPCTGIASTVDLESSDRIIKNKKWRTNLLLSQEVRRLRKNITINISGNRRSRCPGIDEYVYHFMYSILSDILRNYYD